MLWDVCLQSKGIAERVNFLARFTIFAGWACFSCHKVVQSMLQQHAASKHLQTEINCGVRLANATCYPGPNDMPDSASRTSSTTECQLEYDPHKNLMYKARYKRHTYHTQTKSYPSSIRMLSGECMRNCAASMLENGSKMQCEVEKTKYAIGICSSRHCTGFSVQARVD